MTITSRERVLAAVRHQNSDRVPIDLGGSIQSTIHAYAYANLKAALGVPDHNVEIMDTFILAAVVEDSVREALNIDTVPIRCPSTPAACATMPGPASGPCRAVSQ